MRIGNLLGRVGGLLAIFGLLQAPAVADEFSSAMQAAEQDGSARVIVVLKSERAPGPKAGDWIGFNDHVADLQARAIREFDWININELVKFKYSPAMAMTVTASNLESLRRSSSVEAVFEDRYNEAFLDRSVGVIGAATVHSRQHNGGKGWAVAVLDTGVERNHPFLGGRVVAEACFSTKGRMQGKQLNSACPNGKRVQVGRGAARPCKLGACSHGTHVSGIVAGKSAKISGVAPQASIIGVQVATILVDKSCGRAGRCVRIMDSDIIRALEWVFEQRKRYKIAAVNMSLGGGRFKSTCDRKRPHAPVIKLLKDAGIAVVVASGNNGFTDSISAPACISYAISVGATDDHDKVAKFSNSAAILDLMAPGVDDASKKRGRGIYSSVLRGRYARMAGTSMATPHVAGAFALLREAYPKDSVDQLLQRLKKSGRSIRDSRNGLGFKRIQIDAAIRAGRSQNGRRPQPARPAPRPQPTPPPARPAPRPQPTPPPTRPAPRPQPTPPPARPAPRPAPPPPPREKNYDGIRVYPADREKDGGIRW